MPAAVSKASEPWVCKLLETRKEEHLRQKREWQRSKGSKAQAIKELAIQVKGRKDTLPVGATFLSPT
jgi:translation initiation factor IF-3